MISISKTTIKSILEFCTIPLIIYLVILLHEMGHVLAIVRFGGEITEFNASIFGGYVKWNGNVDRDALRIISISGCLFSIVMSLLIGICFYLLHLEIVGVNFIITGLFTNLIYMTDVYSPRSDIYKFLALTPEIDKLLFLQVMMAVVVILYLIVTLYGVINTYRGMKKLIKIRRMRRI